MPYQVIDPEELVNCRRTLQDQLFMQSAAMFKYCNNSGILVDDNLFEEYDIIFRQWIKQRNSNSETIIKENQSEDIDHTTQQNGPFDKSNQIDLARVARIHNILAGKVTPARPASILLIESEMMPIGWLKRILFLRFLGPVKIVRAMMGVCIIMLISFLWVGLDPEVNLKNLAMGFYELNGKPLLVIMLFLLSSAGIGASFAALFELRSFISNRTYDTVYATDYWIRFILGLISGLILAELVPVKNIIDPGSDIGAFSKPILAMLGGFSVQAVYRILQRFVQTLETMVQGRESSQDEVTRKTDVREEAKKQVFRAKTEFLSDLSEIQNNINKNDDIETVKETINKVFKKISSFSEIR